MADGLSLDQVTPRRSFAASAGMRQSVVLSW